MNDSNGLELQEQLMILLEEMQNELEQMKEDRKKEDEKRVVQSQNMERRLKKQRKIIEDDRKKYKETISMVYGSVKMCRRMNRILTVANLVLVFVTAIMIVR